MHERPRMFRILPLLLALLIPLLPPGGASTQKKQGKQPSATEVQRRRADSLAAVRADSVRLAAARDSVRRSDSLAAERLKPRIRELRKLDQSAFGVGERLVFDVNYGYITAGEAIMHVPRRDSVAGRLCYRVEFTVNSLPSFSWIYEVKDKYLTFVDVETLAPWKFEQHIREGSYRRDFIAEFDQYNLRAKTTEGEHDIPEYVHDIMSAFYYARTLDWRGVAVGEGPTLYNFYRNRSFELKVRLLGREDLEVGAGTFRTLVVEPLVKEGGLFKSEGRIVIWLTDDERKIPVRVNTKVVIGSIDSELREYSGLAGPLRSRIE
jgi:hypothetical protein